MRFERSAVSTFFALNGFAHGTWTPRIPALADQIQAGVAAIGLALVGTSLGMIAAASAAGRLCAAFGARTVLTVSAISMFTVLPVLGVVPSAPLLGIVLFGLGLAIGALDVSMNVAAVAVARRLDRPVMPVMHGSLSLGGVLGSLAAAGAAGIRLTPLHHFLVVAAVGIVATTTALRAVPREVTTTGPNRSPGLPARAPFRRPVLWFLAAVALCSVIAEGAGGKWSPLFLVEERGLSEAAAAIGYSTFSIAMAVTRLFGERVQRRWPSDHVLVAASGVACAGLLLAVLVPAPAFGYVGLALTGVGLAYAFPIALAMAGAAGRRTDGGGGEREIGFVTTVAYAGVLAGPPLIGSIAQLTSLGVALGAVGLIAALIGPAALAARAARRAEHPEGRPDSAAHARPLHDS